MPSSGQERPADLKSRGGSGALEQSMKALERMHCKCMQQPWTMLKALAASGSHLLG